MSVGVTHMGPLVCLGLARRQRKAAMATTSISSTTPAAPLARTMRPSVDWYQQASSARGTQTHNTAHANAGANQRAEANRVPICISLKHSDSRQLLHDSQHTPQSAPS